MDDGEPGYFCEGCAAKLTTKGFDVQPISRRNHFAPSSKYAGDPIYQEIVSYLREFSNATEDHNENIQRFMALEDHYMEQAAMVETCYDDIIGIVKEMKRDHLADIANERERYVQTASIEIGHLEDNLHDIALCRDDIEGNLDQVVEGMKHSSDKLANYQQCMNNYYEHLQLYANQIEQQEHTLANILNYNAMALSELPKQVEQYLDSLWQQALSKNQIPSRQPLVPRNEQKNNSQISRPKPLISQNTFLNAYPQHNNPFTIQAPQTNFTGYQNESNGQMNNQGHAPHQGNLFSGQKNLPLIPPNNAANQQMTVKHIHEILPKAVSREEGKKAFRNLAHEEEMLLQAKTSPVFKDI